MTASAQDDRGNPISALRPNDIRRAADAQDPSRAHLAQHLRDAIRAESQRFSARRVGWMIAAFIVWVFIQVAASRPAFRGIPGFRVGVVFVPAILLGIVGREITRRRVSKLVAATAVAEGICGQCCYSLGGVPVDPDGRVTCPECGAAWAQERITRPHWASLPMSFHEERLPWRQRVGQSLFRFFTGTPKPSSLITADHRGRFVRTVDSRFLLVPRARRDELTQPRVAALRKAARQKGRVPRFLCGLPLVIMSVICLVSSISLLLEHEEIGGAVAVLCVGAFFLNVAVAVNFSHLFLPPSHTAHVLVADGLCGCCVASLSDLSSDARGLTTCPACGTTWKTSSQSQP